ncbi:hypothetical protein GCM10023189_33060 [Nibrella saemangeumensis]|uniref:Uncharacterized protein n=1 Tax=Nibrella saemangeumensis TaxID=1084526 RepID=A0ABP8N3R4_9BACT
MATIICAYCGKEAKVRTGAKFCSPSCRVRNHQKQQLNRLYTELEYLARKVEHYEAREGNPVAEKYLSREEIQQILLQGKS